MPSSSKKLIEFWVKGNKQFRLEKDKKDKLNAELKFKIFCPFRDESFT